MIKLKIRFSFKYIFIIIYKFARLNTKNKKYIKYFTKKRAKLYKKKSVYKAFTNGRKKINFYN